MATFTQSMGHPTGGADIGNKGIKTRERGLVVDNAEKPQRSDELEAVSRLVSP